MFKKIRAKLLALPKVWRITLFIFLAFLFGFFLLGSIFDKLGALIYKDDWYPNKSTWLDPVILVPSIVLLGAFGKWLKLDEKK